MMQPCLMLVFTKNGSIVDTVINIAASTHTIVFILVSGIHMTSGLLCLSFFQNEATGLYSHLEGIPKALLPGVGGKKILDFWWEVVNM